MSYRIICTAGRVKHTIFTGMTYAEALETCEFYNWEFDYNGGLVWGLEIEEE